MEPTADPAPVNPPAAPVLQPTDCTAVNGYDWDANVAYAICMAESRGNPNAYGVNTNGTNDAGLMQINSIHTDLISLEDRYDPAKNVDAAYQIYRGAMKQGRDGFSPWSSYNSGKYREFLR